MTTSIGHAALMKAKIKPGYEFDQLLVLGILLICPFHSLPWLILLRVCVCYLALFPSLFCFVLRRHPYFKFDSHKSMLCINFEQNLYIDKLHTIL